MKDPLNRTSGPAIVRLFDICFKQGVIDASELNDNAEARAFLSEHKTAFTFGVLLDDSEYDWKTYRFVLYRWARAHRLTPLAENYIMFIRKPNYLWPLLPYCMQFYLMGIEEWLAYPNVTRIELFKGETKTHWDPKSPNKKMTTIDFISNMHNIARAYRHAPEENRYARENLMDGFCLSIYDLTRKYV